ncbi:probable BOI-related E3 ubiquitin-protein ligase 2 isoform X2 [Cynara cardunculus var. scolymus]|uniref:probable BOI-related E3 ubiquitin-protein ligase 2 isoform X2 n=1 Tax=Cynara cardunculus var. scolymus TaxID=59895 RepID=UPI000D63008E|nr:probable BOI-related E3 ubiquitin-protein ligase 2 isoform X2 [Cynara cardunculus var. scolymus]
MAMPEHHQFHNYLQQQQQQQQSKPFRDIFNNMEGQISAPINYINADQAHHPPYIPQFHVVGFAPGTDVSDGGFDLQRNYDLDSRKKRPREQEFLENNNTNSQISSIDFLQPRSVSTGELRRQDAEIDRFMKIQADRLRQAVLEKVQANQLQIISCVEDKFMQKLREKEAQVENINKKNMELELQVEQLAMEAGTWQQRAKYNENMINTLKFNLQQVYAQGRDSKEGCGDSEVDDTASCCNGRAIDFHLLCKGKNGMRELMTCKVCRINQASMLLLPCKHLCLCKECESKVSLCPLCQCSKYIGMEVYM